MSFMYRFVSALGSTSLRRWTSVDEQDVDFEKRKHRLLLEILKKVSTFQNAEKSKSYNSKEFTDAVVLVYETYAKFDDAPPEIRQKMRDQLVDIIVDSKLAKIFVTIFNDCVEQGMPTRFYNDHKAMMHFINPAVGVIFIIQTFSYTSAKFCKVVANETSLLSTLHRVLTEAREDFLSESRNQELRKLVELCICVVYNTVKHEELDLVDTMHSTGLVAAMEPYLSASDIKVRMYVLMFFVYVANEAEAKTYCSDDESLKLILENLELAMKNKNKHSNGHHNMELLRVVAKLSALDIKTKLGSLGVLDLMRWVVANGNKEEVEEAVRVVWHLAFDSRSAANIQKAHMDALILTRATAYRSSRLRRTSVNIKRTATRTTSRESCDTSLVEALHSPADLIPVEESVPTTPDEAEPQRTSASDASISPDKHIMISYSWVNKRMVMRIKDEIVKEGYKVWIDEINMRGNLLDAMASAVENAWLVLACSSRSYKSSENCRMELEFAHERKKQIGFLILDNFEPDGWLGLLLRKNFYYDFKEPFEEIMAKLLSDIRTWVPENAGKADQEDVKKSEMAVACLTLTPSHAPRTGDDLGCLSYLDEWDAEEVKEWFKKNGIEWTADLATTTGADLHLMAEMQRTTLDCFFRTLEKLQFKTVSDMTKFANALKKL